MALLRISYAPMLPQLAFAAGRGAVRLSAYGVVALLVLVTSPLTLALALLCSPALVATLLCVQLFGDFAARQLSRRSALYHTLASRLHARAFSRLEPRLAERKRALFEGLSGDVVELGAGVGSSFAQLPPAVTRLTAVEPHGALSKAVHASAKAAGVELRALRGDAQAIPLPDSSCDAVILTWQLCSASDPAAALREICRVLRPGGRLVFIEHAPALRAGNSAENHRPLGVRAAWPPLPLWAQQRVACPACKLLHGGCDLTRDAGQLVADACGSRPPASSFDALKLSTFSLRGADWAWGGLEWLHVPHVAGVARKVGAAAAAEPSPENYTPARAPGTVMRRAPRAQPRAAADEGGPA